MPKTRIKTKPARPVNACRSTIVCEDGWLGGKPRLSGTRLSVEFFACYRDEPPQFWLKHYPTLTTEEILFAFAVVDAVLKGRRDASREGVG